MRAIKELLITIMLLPIKFLWRLSGWKITQPLPPDAKLVVTGAPHTTNWDYIVFLMAIAHLRRRPFVTIKKELFFPPLGWLLKALGGVSINRQNPAGISEQITKKVLNTDPILMVFTPEGTRSYTDHWKAGFYQVAMSADVRILCVALNYAEKTLYFDLVFKPTGDIEADFARIQEYQENHGVGKYPENAGKVELRPRDIKRFQDAHKLETATENT